MSVDYQQHAFIVIYVTMYTFESVLSSPYSQSIVQFNFSDILQSRHIQFSNVWKSRRDRGYVSYVSPHCYCQSLPCQVDRARDPVGGWAAASRTKHCPLLQVRNVSKTTLKAKLW